MIAIHVASLLFGGILIAGSFLGGHGIGNGGGTSDAGAAGGATAVPGGSHLDASGSHALGSAGATHSSPHHSIGEGALSLLLGLRFWSFAVAFFGLTGVVLRALGGSSGALTGVVVPLVAGIGAGVAASRIMRRFTSDSVGAVRAAGAWVGREGELLLPVSRDQRGKVRLPLPGGGHVDLVAEAAGDEPTLVAGSVVLVVEVRDNAVLVAPTPSATRTK